MRIEKNKIVFISVVVLVIIFIGSYATLVLSEDEHPTDKLQQPLVPALKEEGENYTSKMDALNDLKEVRQSDPPSIYSEKLLDSLGFYDPALEEKNRERVIDSIFLHSSIDYKEAEHTYAIDENGVQMKETDSAATSSDPKVVIEDFSVTHETFFKVEPILFPSEEKQNSRSSILVRVHGDQKVQVNDRLELILAEEAEINGKIYPKNTLFYGFVSFTPNRLHIKITHITGNPLKLKAYDLQDSNEGIYIENSLRAEATGVVLDGVIQDINIPGVPQISGIKNIFRRNSNRVKVTVFDQYQLILKSES